MISTRWQRNFKLKFKFFILYNAQQIAAVIAGNEILVVLAVSQVENKKRNKYNKIKIK